MKKRLLVEVCVKHYLNDINRLNSKFNIAPGLLLEPKLALEIFTNWLGSRDIIFMENVDQFIINEYDLHLKDQLVSGEIRDSQYSYQKDSLGAFLGYCVRSGYLPENPGEDIL